MSSLDQRENKCWLDRTCPSSQGQLFEDNVLLLLVDTCWRFCLETALKLIYHLLCVASVCVCVCVFQ
uniref:Uncharacterized protein n=1 Tax=Octopus bimaculoides TaxID=37653 RepID=A0A0L8GJJ9_OCTBM